MKKVIGIIGSPRKLGNSTSMVNEVLRGAKDSGAETKVFYLNSMSIKGCQSCMYCRKNDNCCINDDMQEILENIKDSDAVIIGSPIYIYQVSGQTKIMMDRLYPFTDEKHKPRFGKKKLVMVYTQASPFFFSFRTYIRYLRNAFTAMGLQHYKDIIVTKCFNPDVAKNNVKVMKKAYSVGKSLI
ncbi:flavodoxin family protein [Clostridium vincentii]|uniref:Iron-sulfur flavoprotein n=1 Tax=Clostridium vincentii TaxID=52704 RepID=A0A2T0B4M8_9CLOT|nr:flavodoxin family protein [Clostridium vincentii]PRR78848.1 Iron-sulfur flavoprotein [Clostridium vincentii]